MELNFTNINITRGRKCKYVDLSNYNLTSWKQVYDIIENNHKASFEKTKILILNNNSIES